jgi:hypothetical protein
MQDERSTEWIEQRTALQERLLDLAYDASSYLRRHRSALVRTSAALLLAASLAACSSPDQSGLITPLSEEVRRGLPSQPGGYTIDPSTLARDPQGVYHFAWQPSGGGSWNQASASLLRLSEDRTNSLEIPASGDPILHLTPDTPVPLVESAGAALTPTTSTSGGHSGYSWFPFYGGSGGAGPAYRNPSTTVTDGANVQGSTASTSPPSPAARTSGLAHAVSGQAGGTGSGTAASGKSGAGASFGAASAKSSGFSGGGGSSWGGSSG